MKLSLLDKIIKWWKESAGYKFYMFDPQEDITTYELSQIMQLSTFAKATPKNKINWGIFEYYFKQFPESMQRHFTEEKKFYIKEKNK